LPDDFVKADELVRNCRKTAVGSNWAFPVEQRMNDLVDRALASGENTSKQELLAAIVCAFDPEDGAMDMALRQYRTAKAGDVSLRDPEEGNVIRIDRHGPGRRSHVR
jgi:hypothetical protein